MASTKMDLKDNPEVPEKISEHKSVQDQELAVKYDSSEDKSEEDVDSGEESGEGGKETGSSQGRKTCKFCGKEFSSKSSRIRHEKNTHTCHLKCGKELPTKHSKIDHEQSSHRHYGKYFKQTKIHACVGLTRKWGLSFEEKCTRKFKSLTSLNYHKLRVHNQPIKCQKCSTEFTKFKEYLKHRRIEQGKPELPSDIKCSKCHQTFSRGDNFTRHLEEVHMEQKIHWQTFYCMELQCSERFNRKEKLDRHVAEKHFSVRHKCDQCGKQFTMDRNLKAHIKNIHSPLPSTFKCQKCEKYYRRKGDLTRHYQDKHNER